MRIDRPFNQIREVFRITNRENRELLKYVFEKSDNISLWVIGLSIGGISIFANNIADIQKIISTCYLRPILLLLAISVTSGIIYRGLFLYFFVVLNNIQRGIDIAFSNQQTMDTEFQLTGKETFAELVKKVKDGLGDDFSYLIEAYEILDDTNRLKLYQSVVNYYLKSVEFAQKDTSLAFDFVADTYSKFIGTSKDKYLKKFSSHKADQQYKWTLRLTTVFYLTYILTFISALFLFVVAT